MLRLPPMQQEAGGRDAEECEEELARAEQEVGQRGERAVERLRGRIGPTVVLYELLDPPGAGPQGTGTLFVVDVGEDLRSAAGPYARQREVRPAAAGTRARRPGRPRRP
jgi:hypothetical protein